MLLTFLRRYAIGILPRYVIGQVAGSFFLALLTITSVFVLIMVMNEAQRQGLTPQDVLRLVPLVIPATLPYTAPVALLFAVTVVYGRLAADNEIIAVKTAGLGALDVLWPTLIISLLLSAGLYHASSDLIPRATHYAKSVLFSNFEDLFYKYLKKDRAFDNKELPFYIAVKDVKDKKLIGAKFWHRKDIKTDPYTYDAWIDAKEATIRFDLEANMAHVTLVGSEVQNGADNPFLLLITNERFDIPLSGEKKTMDPRVQELTSRQLVARQALRRVQIRDEKRRHAYAAGLWIASGRLERVDWPHIRLAFKDYDYWLQDLAACETEKQMRLALAFGSFFFVLLGGPVGMLFAKRDFLSAFITCFMPIILIYYPLTLLFVNLGKDGAVPAALVYSGNVALGLLAGFFALPPVKRH